MLHHHARQSRHKTILDNGTSMLLCCPCLTDLLAFNDSTISVVVHRAGAAATQLEKGRRLHMQNHCQHCCHHAGQSSSAHRCSCAAPQSAPRGHQTAYGALSFLQPPCQAQMAREMHLPFEWSLMMRAFASWKVFIAYWRPRTAAYATDNRHQVPTHAHDMSSKANFSTFHIGRSSIIDRQCSGLPTPHFDPHDKASIRHAAFTNGNIKICVHMYIRKCDASSLAMHQALCESDYCHAGACRRHEQNTRCFLWVSRSLQQHDAEQKCISR